MSTIPPDSIGKQTLNESSKPEEPSGSMNGRTIKEQEEDTLKELHLQRIASDTTIPTKQMPQKELTIGPHTKDESSAVAVAVAEKNLGLIPQSNLNEQNATFPQMQEIQGAKTSNEIEGIQDEGIPEPIEMNAQLNSVNQPVDTLEAAEEEEAFGSDEEETEFIQKSAPLAEQIIQKVVEESSSLPESTDEASQKTSQEWEQLTTQTHEILNQDGSVQEFQQDTFLPKEAKEVATASFKGDSIHLFFDQLEGAILTKQNPKLTSQKKDIKIKDFNKKIEESISKALNKESPKIEGGTLQENKKEYRRLALSDLLQASNKIIQDPNTPTPDRIAQLEAHNETVKQTGMHKQHPELIFKPVVKLTSGNKVYIVGNQIFTTTPLEKTKEELLQEFIERTDFLKGTKELVINAIKEDLLKSPTQEEMKYIERKTKELTKELSSWVTNRMKALEKEEKAEKKEEEYLDYLRSEITNIEVAAKKIVESLICRNIIKQYTETVRHSLEKILEHIDAEKQLEKKLIFEEVIKHMEKEKEKMFRYVLFEAIKHEMLKGFFRKESLKRQGSTTN